MTHTADLDRLVRPQTHTGHAFQVLEFTVPIVDACKVRRAISSCPGAGVLRCEPLQQSATYTNDAPRARLIIRLDAAQYATVLHCLLECTPDGEIGHLCGWSEHLRRYGVGYGG